MEISRLTGEFGLVPLITESGFEEGTRSEPRKLQGKKKKLLRSVSVIFKYKYPSAARTRKSINTHSYF